MLVWAKGFYTDESTCKFNERPSDLYLIMSMTNTLEKQVISDRIK